MKIATSNRSVQRDLERLIRSPRRNVAVKRVLMESTGRRVYDVKCMNMLDLLRSCPQMSDGTVTVLPLHWK